MEYSDTTFAVSVSAGGDSSTMPGPSRKRIRRGGRRCVAYGCGNSSHTVSPWIKSLANQVYNCARCGNGDPDLNMERWRAVGGNHAMNIHHHPENTRFTECEHSLLTEDRLWFKEGYLPYISRLSSIPYICYYRYIYIAGSKATTKLRDIIYPTYMERDIRMLSSTSKMPEMRHLMRY